MYQNNGETETTEHHHEIVKKLLQRLPESERTVVTLHYLGEMTAKEIGRFLGVSVNTINSRLRRAKKRLQEREELLIQEMLGSVPITCYPYGEHRPTSCQHKTDTPNTHWETFGAMGGSRYSCCFNYIGTRCRQSISRPLSETV